MIERSVLFSSKRKVKKLLQETCGFALKKADKRVKSMVDTAAECVSDAYWIGVSDGKTGRKMQPGSQIEAATKGKSEMAKDLCGFVYQAYCKGYELGQAERPLIGGDFGESI